MLSLAFLTVSVLLNGCKKDNNSSIVNKPSTSTKQINGVKALAKKDTTIILPPTTNVAKPVVSSKPVISSTTAKKDTTIILPPKN